MLSHSILSSNFSNYSDSNELLANLPDTSNINRSSTFSRTTWANKGIKFSDINIKISISSIVTNLWTAAWHRGGGGRAGTVWELPLPVPEDHDTLILVADVLDVLHVVLQVEPGDWARVTAVIVSGFVSLTVHNITGCNGQFGQVHWLWQTKLIFASFRSAVRCAVVIF